MRLVTGGAHQGKLDYVLSSVPGQHGRVAQGGDCSLTDFEGIEILSGFHILVRRILTQGGDPHAAVEALLHSNPDIIIITDEIGCGVIPMDEFERKWRETTGRLCCALAQRAHKVERVFCGIASVIKEGSA